MVNLSVDQLYEQQIKAQPRATRLRLLARIADDLASADTEDDALLDLLDMEGVGAELWQGIDAQRYIDEARDA